LSELERRNADTLEQVCVVDFNPQVYHTLRARNVKVFYGDIAHAETLANAGIDKAEIVISTVPDSLLKGTTNEKLVRHVRNVNPNAKIIATTEVLAEAEQLYAAGANYVTMARLTEANELVDVIAAAEDGLLTDMRANIETRLRDRREVLP
jgi:voltage-gated potassium channel Kch